MNKVKIALSLLLITSLIFAMGACSPDANNESSPEAGDQGSIEEFLTVYSGAGLRKPMDEIGEIFEEKYGVRVDYSYAGSAQNLTQIELVGEGDLYVPGATFYIEQAMEKGFVSESKDVVYHIPVIGVPAGNPGNIQGLDDLAREGVSVVLGDERSAAIGKSSQKILKNKGILEEVEKNVVAKDATVNEVMVHIAMGQADACIIWGDNVMNVDEIEMIEIEEEFNDIKIIPVGILTFTKKEELAKKYLEFVVSEEGRSIFEKHGFKTI